MVGDESTDWGKFSRWGRMNKFLACCGGTTPPVRKTLYLAFFYLYLPFYPNSQGFSYGGGWGKSPPHRKISPNRLFPPHQRLIAPLNNSFQVITLHPIKTIFNCSHCSYTIFVLISYSLDTQVRLNLILIDVQYSKKGVFSF